MDLKKYYGSTFENTKEEVEILIKTVLSDYVEKKISRVDFIKVLYVLVDKQASTYELLNAKLKNNLDEVVSNIWDAKNIDEMCKIFYIIISFGLQKSYNKIKASLNYWKNADIEVYQYLYGVFMVNGDDISDPFNSYENYYKKSKE